MMSRKRSRHASSGEHREQRRRGRADQSKHSSGPV